MSRKHNRGNGEEYANACVKCDARAVYARDLCQRCYMASYRRRKAPLQVVYNVSPEADAERFESAPSKARRVMMHLREIG